MLLHVVLILSLSTMTAAMQFMREPHVEELPKKIFLVASVLVFFLCLLLTQVFSEHGTSRKFYWKAALCAAVFAVLMILPTGNGGIGIALTVAYIALQFYALKKGAEEKAL